MATFYANQERARRNTTLLVFYFGVAVLLIVLAVNGVLFVADIYLMGHGEGIDETLTSPALSGGFFEWLISPRGWVASAITGLVLVAGSAHKTLTLGHGGDRVAIMAGGTLIDLNTQDPHERQLLNIVEEMAIAAGIHTPRVYLLRDETGINAFVAGLTPNEAALAVTRGALDTLSRDELQGVIGHEFSHILNSDMRINVRIIGVLAGILMIGHIGRFLMQTRTRRRSSRDQKGGNPLPLIGLALWLIGLIGLFFGQLIQAALSRQREFLADASAVQFTRNPLGIGGALLKIRQASGQSYLQSRHAGDISHMCFGEVMRHRFQSLFATHPPLTDRIRAIDPRLEHRLAQVAQDTRPTMTTPQGAPAMTNFTPPVAAASTLKASVGQLTTETLAVGQRLHRQIPAALLEAAHATEQAPLLLYALVLAAPQQDPAIRQTLAEQFAPTALEALLGFRETLMHQPLSLRLPLTELIMPTLQRLPQKDQSAILAQLQQLILADKRYTLSECAYFLLATRYLAPTPRHRSTLNSIHKVEPHVVNLFVALAHASRQTDDARRQSFSHAMRCLGIKVESNVVDTTLDASALQTSVHLLARLSPLLKQSLIDNAVDMVIADQSVCLAEIELLRAFSALLDCPMPPVDDTLLKA